MLFAAILCAVALVMLQGKIYAQVHGLVLGFTLTTVLFVGGVYNPAVVVGPMFLSAITMRMSFTNLFLYLVGPLVGAALAACAIGCMEKGGKRKKA